MRTFSTSEMAVYIACLMIGPVQSHCELEPLLVDISGNMSSTPNLRALLDQIKANLDLKQEIRTTLSKEYGLDDRADGAAAVEPSHNPSALRLHHRPHVGRDTFRLPDWETQIKPLQPSLEGLVDLDRVAVIVGFGEIGK